MYTLNDFFCGCGGLGLGFKNAGFQIVGAWDFDKFAVASYRENVGDHVVQADIQEMHIEDVPKADVWSFGFPCQDLSVAVSPGKWTIKTTTVTTSARIAAVRTTRRRVEAVCSSRLCGFWPNRARERAGKAA